MTEPVEPEAHELATYTTRTGQPRACCAECWPDELDDSF